MGAQKNCLTETGVSLRRFFLHTTYILAEKEEKLFLITSLAGACKGYTVHSFKYSTLLYNTDLNLSYYVTVVSG